MQKVDVFISAKSSDFKHAKNVYDFLIANGLSVFFSEESLPKIGNADYRQQIDKALDATQHMVVVTSSKENVASEWVEAEWGLFINEKRSGIKKGNIVTIIAEKMEIKDLPASLRYYQVERLSEEGLSKVLSFLGVVSQTVAFKKSNNKEYIAYASIFILFAFVLFFFIYKKDIIGYGLGNSQHIAGNSSQDTTGADEIMAVAVSSNSSLDQEVKDANNTFKNQLGSSETQVKYENSSALPTHVNGGSLTTDETVDTKSSNQKPTETPDTPRPYPSQPVTPVQNTREVSSSRQSSAISPEASNPSFHNSTQFTGPSISHSNQLGKSNSTNSSAANSTLVHNSESLQSHTIADKPAQTAEASVPISNLFGSGIGSRDTLAANSSESLKPFQKQARANEHAVPINNLFRLPTQ